VTIRGVVGGDCRDLGDLRSTWVPGLGVCEVRGQRDADAHTAVTSLYAASWRDVVDRLHVHSTRIQAVCLSVTYAHTQSSSNPGLGEPRQSSHELRFAWNNVTRTYGLYARGSDYIGCIQHVTYMYTLYVSGMPCGTNSPSNSRLGLEKHCPPGTTYTTPYTTGYSVKISAKFRSLLVCAYVLLEWLRSIDCVKK
jgi:hypothetical protein